jgi:enoyl-CoA hydratase
MSPTDNEPDRRIRVTAFQHVRYQIEGGVARVTLDRPEKRNALSRPLLEELEAALWDADDDKAVHCVVVAGAGEAFCAGYDLSQMADVRQGSDRPRRGASTIDDDSWQLEQGQRRLRVLWDMHKPTIARVHGYCIAGGTDLAFFCDMVIAADDALIGFPPARNLGSLPNNMWLYHCGPQWAKRLTLTGDLITGADAARIGLVMKAVPADVLDAEVDGLAGRLALIDPDLLSSNKRVINMGLELMGARVLQRYAAETDARAHRAPATREYFAAVAEQGLKGAFRQRDERFGDSRVRVTEPEIRDEGGRFVDG